MGVFLNPSESAFDEVVHSDIYVDKTVLLVYTNSVFKTAQKYVCVSRPRRFGKSLAASMIVSYYGRNGLARELFQGLHISSDANFGKYANKYDVISLNMQEFLSNSKSMEELLSLLARSVLWDLLTEYPDFRYFDDKDLSRTMADIYSNTKTPFVVVIDEWDCVFREYQQDHEAQRKYLDFLRGWLKDKTYLGLVYMTGILPIKKYGTHSALNMFDEFSMTNPRELAEFVGFTEAEVNELCCRYNMDFQETKSWYDGYYFSRSGSVYSPRSVVAAMRSGVFDTYWNQTETFEALRIYIDMNFAGLREAVIGLLSGARRKIITGTFVNDMTTFSNLDDVLTLLVHLGYLGYDFANKEVFIPNREIQQEYIGAMSAGGWEKIVDAVQESERLLECTLAQDEQSVAEAIAKAHLETSHLQYNDENALSYTVSLAYYSARQKYTVIRELPTGKGFADLVFLPRPKYANLPAMMVELKWNQDADTAIRQIKEKGYAESLKDYQGDVLLVGINYDKSSRKHTCQIEKLKM